MLLHRSSSGCRVLVGAVKLSAALSGTGFDDVVGVMLIDSGNPENC